MKDIKTITKDYVINGQHYKVQQFTASTDAEKKICDKPFIAVHYNYTEKDLPLNGLQMLISKTMDELVGKMELDSHRRNYLEKHPDADDLELLMYLRQFV